MNYCHVFLNYIKKRIPLVEQNIAQRMLISCTDLIIIYAMLWVPWWISDASIDSIGKVYPCELSDYNDYCTGNVDDSDYIVWLIMQ